MAEVNFVMAVHCHQPVGNFDFVFEKAVEKAYIPLLQALEKYPEVVCVLHYSGVLLEWMRTHRPDAFALIRKLCQRNQVEMMAGGFYEPILTILPERDRFGQLQLHREYIQKHFGKEMRGIWLTERVWEQGLVSSLKCAGFDYTCLDDSHFLYGGISPVERGYYVTEDQGRKFFLFPSLERLRYSIPFHDPRESIEFIKGCATEDGKSIVVYADDGEKFGLWPGTYKHCYEDGWIERFIAGLLEERESIRLRTFSWVLENIPPVGLAYLPDAAYREMMEWALPAETGRRRMELEEELKRRGLFEKAKYFFKGTFWRSFLAKYAESNEMYSKMLLVSEKVNGIRKHKESYKRAREELYRGQCNCAYWHGIFGGLYLPHLRRAVYEHLIKAEKIAERQPKRKYPLAKVRDFNYDGKEEVLLSNEHLNAYIKPHLGGHIYELDFKEKDFNILATLTRREEAYHKVLLERAAGKPREVASIHERVSSKEADLQEKLIYDRYKRESLMDHFLGSGATLEAFASSREEEKAPFIEGRYNFTLKREKGLLRLALKQEGQLREREKRYPIEVTKTIELRRGKSQLDFIYLINNLGFEALDFLLAVEFNFAMQAADAPDRYYLLEDGRRSRLGSILDILTGRFVIVDDYSGFEVALEFEEQVPVWAFPVETVSQSEAGFERVYQSSAVVARWGRKLEGGKVVCIRFNLKITRR